MSNETLGEFSLPGPALNRETVIVRVGSFNYLFERAPQGGLAYVSRSAVLLGDDDDDYSPFDPSEYR